MKCLFIIIAKRRLFHPIVALGLLSSLFVSSLTAETVIDNLGAETSGFWTSTSADHAYPHPGGNYHTCGSGDGSKYVRWRPDLAAGEYEIHIWLPEGLNNRATDAPFTIVHANGSDTILVNQKAWSETEQWVRLGSGPYTFNAGTGGYVELTNDANGYVIADAVRFVPIMIPEVVIVDNADTVSSGFWTSQTRQGYYGANYAPSHTNSSPGSWMAFRPDLAGGMYKIEVRVPEGLSQYSTHAPFTVHDNTGTATTYEIDQTGPAAWLELPYEHPFDAGTAGYVELTDAAPGNYVIGDAVRFTKVGDLPPATAAGRTSTNPLKVPGVDPSDGTWYFSSTVPGRIVINSGKVAEDWDFRGYMVFLGFPNCGVRQSVLHAVAPSSGMKKGITFEKNCEGSFIENCDVEGLFEAQDTSPAIKQMSTAIDKSVSVRFNHFYWQSSDCIAISNGVVEGNLFEACSSIPESDAHVDYIAVYDVPADKSVQILDNDFRVANCDINVNNAIRVYLTSNSTASITISGNMIEPWTWQPSQSVPLTVNNGFTGPVYIDQNIIGDNHAGSYIYTPGPDTYILWGDNFDYESGQLIDPRPAGTHDL